MISRMLAISLLGIGLSAFSPRAIATIPSQATIAPVKQPDSSKQNNKPDAGDNAVTDQLLGMLAICLLITPVLGRAAYKQHLDYRSAIHHNKVETLERVWKLPSKIR